MKILVIGCGSIGRRHAANAAAIADAAVMDLDRTLAVACARETGCPGFSDLDQALAWKPDGVVVATPHDSHLEVARKAIDTGLDVLVEKPLSNDLNGVLEFLDHADALGRRIFVVCNMRFHPAIMALRENMPRIGRPLFSRAHYGNYLPNMRPGADYRELYCASRKRGGGVVLYIA